jgi:hypothetical protein
MIKKGKLFRYFLLVLLVPKYNPPRRAGFGNEEMTETELLFR